MRRILTVTLFACATVAVLGVWSSGSALGRDSDGSRMQARAHDLGSSDSDTLSPPNDAIDWRYFRLKNEQSVSITLDASPNDVPVTVSLNSAVGKQLASSRTKNGRLSVSRKLDPGLYYVAVSADSSTSYRLTLN